MKKKAVQNNILNRHWHSLSQLKEYLEKNTNVTIIEFKGWYLKTNQGTYYLTIDGLQLVPLQ